MVLAFVFMKGIRHCIYSSIKRLVSSVIHIGIRALNMLKIRNEDMIIKKIYMFPDILNYL